MDSNPKENQNVEQGLYEITNMGTILEPKNCKQMNNPYDIKCFQSKLKQKEKFTLGFHKDALITKGDFQ